MQITAYVDCTLDEARVFLGLPDVQPLQASVMAHMEKRMLAEVDRFSPDRLMKTWMALFGQNPPARASETRRDCPKGSSSTP